jgi:hypothetical protein
MYDMIFVLPIENLAAAKGHHLFLVAFLWLDKSAEYCYIGGGISHLCYCGGLKMEAVIREYDAKLDSKKRLTLREANFDYYHVSVLPDQKIVLEPRVLTSPFTVSANTLKMMDQSVENMKKGKVSPAIDLSEFME